MIQGRYLDEWQRLRRKVSSAPTPAVREAIDDVLRGLWICAHNPRRPPAIIGKLLQDVSALEVAFRQ